MKIYNYHPITKEYLSESIADESPLEEGVYLIPANASTIQPPQTEENQVACFENNEWVIKPDFRGKTYYDSNNHYNAVIINFIGDIPKNLVPEIPANILLDRAKQAKIQENNSNCIQRFSQGIIFNDNKYDMDDTAKANILLILQNASETDIIPYLDYNSNVINMSKTEVKELSLSIIETTKNIYMKQKANFDAINNASSIDEVNAIDTDYSKI